MEAPAVLPQELRGSGSVPKGDQAGLAAVVAEVERRLRLGHGRLVPPAGCLVASLHEIGRLDREELGRGVVGHEQLLRVTRLLPEELERAPGAARLENAPIVQDQGGVNFGVDFPLADGAQLVAR